MKQDTYRLQMSLDDSHWWYRARREILCDVVVRFVAPGCEIIDYGCGTGAIAARLRDLGYRVTGAEVSAEMRAACLARGIATIDPGAAPLPPEGADCVICCDVLEHAEDDVGLLETLRRAIRPGGLFVGTVPAYEFLWSGEDYASEHFRRYTRATLIRSLDSAGYQVVRSSYFNTLLFPLASGTILAKRLFRPRDMYRSNLKALPRWQNELLRALFAAERDLLRWFPLPFGLSLLFVARPRTRVEANVEGQEVPIAGAVPRAEPCS